MNVRHPVSRRTRRSVSKPASSKTAKNIAASALTQAFASTADVQEAVDAGALTHERLRRLNPTRIEAYDKKGLGSLQASGRFLRPFSIAEEAKLIGRVVEFGFGRSTLS
jgi:hypothetical protein